MTPLRFIAYTLVATFLNTTGFVPVNKKPAGVKPPITIVTDPSWDVSAGQTPFGEYPLSAGKIVSAISSLDRGAHKAVAANYAVGAQIIPGTVPIWRNQAAETEWEAYQFRKAVPLGADPIRKATLEVNCDDVARIYINQRLVSADQRDGSMKDGYDRWFTFRNVTGYLYKRVYTYDVTDYFFTNVNNTILVEAVSVAFDDGHAYLSAKLVLEFGPMPEPARPAAAPRAKRAPAAEPKRTSTTPAVPSAAAQPATPEKTIFEAGHDPEIEKLHAGSILELGQVSFRANDYRLDSASYRTLAALATFMKRHPSLKIEVGGHTNLRPNDSFAADLSANRARAVMRYLTDNGVAADRVTYKGYGKSRPRVNAISREADRENQRVEVKVLEK